MVGESERKRRQYGPKTKTGCKTCKIRRIKCDETNPVCIRCTSTGRKCDGYIQELSIASNDKNLGTMVQRISTQMPGNRQEKRGFQYFITQTAFELSGYFSNEFWEKLVLQASTAEPSLRHAIVAIGSLHEEFAHNQLSYQTEQQSKKQLFAISQYTKAIGHLRKTLENGKQAPITALMSCILFACFDSLRGFFENAVMHLRSGLKILQDYKPQSSEDAFMLETHITPLFMRLSIQAILYIDTRSTPERVRLGTALTAVCDKEGEVPEEFETLEEARKLMVQAANGLFIMFYMCEHDKAMQYQPPEAKRMFLQYTRQMSAWNRSFEKFMAAKSHTLNSRELRGAAMLKIHQLISTIMRDITPDETDTRHIAASVNDRQKFRRFTSDFKIVVNLAKSLVVASEQDIKSGKPPLTFSTDLGLVGPLYYVAIRCRDQITKMQALELLHQLPRKEGMWDSESAAKMVKEYWELERLNDESQNVSEGQVSSVPLCDLVDLVFGDGMRWEWKWKYAGVTPLSLKREDGSDAISTFSNDWTDLLEDQSWFKEGFAMSNETDFGIGSFGVDGISGIDSNVLGPDLESYLGTGSLLDSDSSISPGPSMEEYTMDLSYKEY